MPTISIVINADTRPQNDTAHAMFSGTSNEDYLTDGVVNKIKFFDGFDREVILFVDEHEPISEKTLNHIRGLVDTLVVRKHTSEPCFNDMNYMAALFLARGEYIAHFDQDCAAFAANPEYPQYLIDLLETWKYVSYPSHWTPNAVTDPSFNYRWASTRFFMCKKETIDFNETVKCLKDYDYFRNKYNPSRVHAWTEHILGLVADSSVYYPPIELDKGAIFCWGHYEKYILQRLNNQTYDEVKQFISQRNIHYPCDLDA